MSQTHPSRTRRPLVLVCIALSMFMVAMEATVVATATPSIVGALGGFELYSWVFTAFLLAQSGVTVMWGKLADLYGRKPVLLAGLGIFLVGSALCGLSWSMGSLVAFRLLQGLGAGAILPVVMTLIGDLYTVKERPSIQGYTSGVWASAAVLGPLLGGLIVQHLSWPWIFWINLPLGVLVIAGLLLFLHEDAPHRGHALDLAGAGLFLVVVSALLMALTRAGEGMEGAPWVVGGVAVFAVFAPLFIWQERRAKEPMVAFGLWVRPVMVSANSVTVASSMAFMGVTACLPIYVQGVMGRTPTEAGLAIGMMSLGWPGASVLAQYAYRAIGVAWTARLGALCLIAGTLGLLLVNPQTGVVTASLACLLIGAGMGFLTNVTNVLIQDGVAWSERGAATAANAFGRNLGNMLGAAMAGGVLNAALQIAASARDVPQAQVMGLLKGAAPPQGSAEALRAVLGQGVMATFVLAILCALATVILAWRMPVRSLEEQIGRAAA